MKRIAVERRQRGRGLRPPGRRRAHQARRPARAELQERVRSHAGRAPARGRRLPAEGAGEANRIAATADREATVIKAEATARAKSRAATAMPSATRSSPMPTLATRSSSSSTARCRPTSRACSPRHAADAHAGQRFLQVLRRPARKAATGPHRAPPEAMSDLVVGRWRLVLVIEGLAVGARAASWPSAASRRRSTPNPRCERRVACVGWGSCLVWLIAG